MSEVGTVTASARQCAGLVRIVQEALVNVRKHSGATTVAIRLVHDGTGLKVTVVDDGAGFPFAGRLTDDQLWAQHTGPLVIKERARAIGAALAVESAPGSGARVEVVVPDV